MKEGFVQNQNKNISIYPIFSRIVFWLDIFCDFGSCLREQPHFIGRD